PAQCRDWVRLADGGSRCAGRVEVKQQGKWGTVCGDYWSMNDAAVVCKQLECGSAVGAPHYGYFGPGSGPIWMDDVGCKGTESALSDCRHRGWGKHNCNHAQDAGVMCSGSAGFGSLRLVGGGSRCDRRVEIFQDGAWGRVLDDQWDVQEASVVCRQLRCGEAGTAYSPPKAERGTGPVGLRGVRCAGHEANLSLCNTSLPESALAAGVAEDVGVVCGGECHCAGPRVTSVRAGSPWQQLGFVPAAGSRRLRLVNGAGRCAGRVEIYYQGVWGTVCDDGWDPSDAAVVCHQLGCGGAVEAAGSARFGEGSGQIWLSGVNCSGAEAALWDCPAGPWGQHDCGHKEDAGVICSGPCQELWWEPGSWGGQDAGRGLGVQRCPGSHSPGQPVPLWGLFLPEFTALRLENSDGCSGLLQVFYNGTWGSVCSNSMTADTVTLVCKELGCGDGGTLERRQPPYRESGPAWLDRVQCGESTSSFWQCPSTPWNPQSCQDPREETNITCNGNSDPPGYSGQPSSCSPLPWPSTEKELRGAFPFRVRPFCCLWHKHDHSHTRPTAVATQAAGSAWGRQRHLQVRSQKRPDRFQKSLPSIDKLLLCCEPGSSWG
uniref:SRCR domain-containing protein n=1 Tax=Athene cunicularia TaxID=194338 RepID=A0A663N8X9_ATHCN